MAESSKDSAFKTTLGKDLKINLAGLKCTIKQKFTGKLKTSHSPASSASVQSRKQLCHLLLGRTLVPVPHLTAITTHRGISNVPVGTTSSHSAEHPVKHKGQGWLWPPGSLQSLRVPRGRRHGCPGPGGLRAPSRGGQPRSTSASSTLTNSKVPVRTSRVTRWPCTNPKHSDQGGVLLFVGFGVPPPPQNQSREGEREKYANAQHPVKPLLT